MTQDENATKLNELAENLLGDHAADLRAKATDVVDKPAQWPSKVQAGRASWVVKIDGETKGQPWFKTKDEALAHRDQIIRDIHDGGHISKNNQVSFSFLAAEFLKDVEEGKRTGIYSGSHFKLCGCAVKALLETTVPVRGGVEKPLGKWLVSDLTTAHIQKKVLPQLAEGRKRATVERYFSSLSALFGFAVLMGWARKNPCREASVKKVISKDNTHDKAEKIGGNVISAIIASAGKWSLHIAFAASTGLRSGEQRGLRWKHIDFDRGFVRVVQAAKFDNTIGVTKTRAGVRDVPLQDHILTGLR